MKTALILGFIILLMSFHSKAQQTIDKLNTNQLKLPKESVSKALVLDATGQVKSSSTVTDTELSYLDGLTDTLVNLLSGKANDSDVVKLSTNQSIDGIKTFTGKLIASSTTNGSIPCPGMTQTQRDALTPANGECVYNSTSLKLNIYDGSVWKDVGGSGGISLWVTSTGYIVNDVVIQSDKIYICLVAHTSGTFATDLSSGYWNEISKVMTAKSKNTSSLTIDELQIPNNQLVQTSTNKYYVETGNKNILTNPSFEHSSVISGWTNSAGGAIANNAGSLIIDGSQSVTVALSSQIMDFYQDSTLYNAEFNGSVQGIATVRVNTTVAGVRVCSRANGVVIASNCVNVVNDGKWGLYKVPFILAFGSNGISINTNSVAVSGNINIDDAFVGASDITQNMSACNSPSCTTEFSAFVDAAGIVTNENVDWINGNGTLSGGGSSITSLNFQTGLFSATPNCVASAENTTGYSAIINSAGTTGVSVRNFTTPVPTNTTGIFRIVCQRSGSDFTTAKQLSNGNTYSSTNADTNWASCGHTTSSFTGFGTVSAIETQCKRQGSDLLIKGKFTSGTVTAVEARVSLPIWNGVQLVSANSSIISSVQLAGDGARNNASSTYFRNSILIEPSVSYITCGAQSSATSALTKQTGANCVASGDVFSFTARIPIEGWQNSNIIIGQFNGLESCSSTLNCTDTFSATITNTGAVVAGSENVDFITGNCSKGGVGITNCTINTGVFSVVPNLVATIDDGAGGCREARTVETNTNTSFRVDTFSSAGSATDCRFRVVLQKSGADYAGKTAMAVASDQNIRTPGVTNSVVYSAYIAASGTVASEIGNLINGNCTVASTNVFTCTFTSGIFASDPVCNLTVLGASGASRSAYIVTSPTTSGLTYLTYNTSGPTPTALNVQLTCHGVSP